MSVKDQLEELLLEWKKCKRCPLHRNRKKAVLPFGSAEGPLVAFVLDRLDIQSIYGDNLSVSPQVWILRRILSLMAGPSIEDLWVTPVVLCPTYKSTPKGREPDLMPMPQANHVKACRERLHKELHLLQPRMLIACGSGALKALHAKSPPKFTEVFGVVSEVYIQGDLVPYAVPLMTTYSVSHLDRLGQSNEELWHEFYAHLAVSVEVAEDLKGLEGAK